MLISIRTMQSVAMGTMLAAFGAISGPVFAQTTPTVTYEAKGRFGTTISKGSDLFRLAGEPFDIMVTAGENTKPHSNGKGYATYTGLSAKGTVTSGLIPQSPVTLSSTHTFMVLALGNPKYDIIELVIPVTVVKENVTITAKITAPHGTFTKWTIQPFSSTVKLTASNSTVGYASGSNGATLSIQNGSLTATAGAPAIIAAVRAPFASLCASLLPANVNTVALAERFRIFSPPAV